MADPIIQEWTRRHIDAWRERGHSYSANRYAHIVLEHRRGLRSSLSFDNDLGWGRKTNGQARALLRREIDDIIKESRMGYVEPESHQIEDDGVAAALRNFEEACNIMALVGSPEQRRVAITARGDMREVNGEART